MVSAQYGWTDDQIMDLPLCRLRQITDTITRREEYTRWERLKVTEWQTRQICTFLATSMSVWGDASEVVEAAAQLSLTGNPAGQSAPGHPVPQNEPARVGSFGPPPGDSEEGKEAVETEVTGVPAGVRFDDLPEMPGVPVSGPQRVAADTEVRGKGALIGSAESLVNALEKGIA